MTATEILQKHRLKKTTPRVAIIQELLNGQGPASEAEIKAKMGDLYDRVTFYRNVHSLIEVGILHRIVADNANIKYALNYKGKEHQHAAGHAHFHCRECDRLLCLSDIDKEALPAPHGFICEEYNVIIKGLCDKCSIKE